MWLMTKNHHNWMLWMKRIGKKCQNGKRLRFLLDESFSIFPVRRKFLSKNILEKSIYPEGKFHGTMIAKIISLTLFPMDVTCSLFGGRWCWFLSLVYHSTVLKIAIFKDAECWLLTMSLKPSCARLMQNEKRNRYSVSCHMRPRMYTVQHNAFIHSIEKVWKTRPESKRFMIKYLICCDIPKWCVHCTLDPFKLSFLSVPLRKFENHL